jgi:hypothetical protein
MNRLSFNIQIWGQEESNRMKHQVTYYNGVLTVRLNGRANVMDVAHDIRSTIEKQVGSIVAILDLTFANSFDQQFKSMFYRIFQHRLITCVGVCGINAQVGKDVNDLLTVLRRSRRVVLGETESDLRSDLGLVSPLVQQKKLSGMLSYLKKA